ncbi:hypothetical protein V8E52_000121 [Russula decolorans]
MFGFFSRKQQPAAKVSNLPSDDPMAVDSEPQQLRTPSPSEAAFNGLGLHPSIAMTLPPGSSHSPIPAVPPTPEALHSLITSIPAKTLHAYLLDNIPAAPPDILAALASFFATLSPPPLLHCVRCHDDYTDIENGDRSCRVPHDDDSAEVEYIGHKRGDSDYETYYGCCGKTVEGEGDLGPPDGWCYEGMHTTDTKRARFRADSTNADDKLDSCLRLNCHNIRARFPNAKESVGAGASTSGRAKRARPPTDEGDGDDEDGGLEGTEDTDIAEIARGVDALSPKTKSKGKAKSKSKVRAPKPKAETVAAATPAATPARGRRRPRSRVRVQVPPRSEQESDVGSSGKAPAAPATPASRPSRQRRRSDAKPRSAASSPAGKATSPPSSPNARGRKPASVAKMDSVEIVVTRSQSRSRSRIRARGSGAETGEEKTARGTTEGKMRKRRKVAHTATA